MWSDNFFFPPVYENIHIKPFKVLKLNQIIVHAEWRLGSLVRKSAQYDIPYRAIML